MEDEDGVANAVAAATEKIAKECIQSKGAFSISIGSGTTVEALMALKGRPGIDWNKVQVYFGNERVMGPTAGECVQMHSKSVAQGVCTQPHQSHLMLRAVL